MMCALEKKYGLEYEVITEMNKSNHAKGNVKKWHLIDYLKVFKEFNLLPDILVHDGNLLIDIINNVRNFIHPSRRRSAVLGRITNNEYQLLQFFSWNLKKSIKFIFPNSLGRIYSVIYRCQLLYKKLAQNLDCFARNDVVRKTSAYRAIFELPVIVQQPLRVQRGLLHNQSLCVFQ